MRKVLIGSVAASLVLVPAALADGGEGDPSRRRPLRDVQRFAQPQRRGPADRGPVHAHQPAGGERRRDHPARTAGRRPDQRVRLRRRRHRAPALPGQLPLDLAQRRGADPLPLPLLRRVEHRHPVRLRPQQRRRIGGRDDAYGFGAYPGQFGMAVFSRYPIDPTRIRTFQKFLWKDMPGRAAGRPGDAGAADWYSPAELAVFRLTSKSHWDVPVMVGSKAMHFLFSHPTPPVFDGPEDATGRATSTRSASGPTTSRRGRAGTSTTTAVAPAASSRARVRDRRRPELRPARRRQHPRRDPAVLDHNRVNTNRRRRAWAPSSRAPSRAART